MNKFTKEQLKNARLVPADIETMPKHLNDLPGFSWLAVGGNEDNLGKACIQQESFWIKECHPRDNGEIWDGIVSNNLLMDCLKFGEKVTFTPTIINKPPK